MNRDINNAYLWLIVGVASTTIQLFCLVYLLFTASYEEFPWKFIISVMIITLYGIVTTIESLIKLFSK